MEEWPLSRFPVGGLRWRPHFAVRDGGTPMAGAPQIGSAAGGGWWTAELRDSQLSTPADYEDWWALEALASGGLNRMVVPFLSPWADIGTPTTRAVELNADAALRAPSLGVTTTDGAPPTAGQHFTIEGAVLGARLYRVSKVLHVDGALSTVAIWPPLREAALSGTVLDLNTPRCVMRVLDAEAMSPEISEAWMSRPSVSFVEDVRPI